jgi:hypothetical protein
MKTVIIATLIPILFLMEIVLTISTLTVYLMWVDGETLTSKLVDKLIQ